MNISFSDVVNNTISEHWRVDLPPTLNRIQGNSNKIFPEDGMDGVGMNATERCEDREVYFKNALEPILKVASSTKERAQEFEEMLVSFMNKHIGSDNTPTITLDSLIGNPNRLGNVQRQRRLQPSMAGNPTSARVKNYNRMLKKKEKDDKKKQDQPNYSLNTADI